MKLSLLIVLVGMLANESRAEDEYNNPMVNNENSGYGRQNDDFNGYIKSKDYNVLFRVNDEGWLLELNLTGIINQYKMAYY